MESAIHQDTRVHDFTKNTQDYTRLYYRLHNHIVLILFDSKASCWAETKNSWDNRCPDKLNPYLANIFMKVWFHPVPKKDMEDNMLRRSCSTTYVGECWLFLYMQCRCPVNIHCPRLVLTKVFQLAIRDFIWVVDVALLESTKDVGLPQISECVPFSCELLTSAMIR